MQSFKKLYTLHPLLLVTSFLMTIYIAKSVNPTSFCGNIQIKEPFLSHKILCRSRKLYFQTSSGLFPISFIDYKTKTLIISHPSSSSTRRSPFQDLEKLGVDFHPKYLNCSHYRRVYRRSLDESDKEVGLRTRISFDIPEHVPDICKECEKPNGNCGVGLKCICHPKQCKDKVISWSGSMNPAGNILFSLLSFTVFVVLNYEAL